MYYAQLKDIIVFFLDDNMRGRFLRKNHDAVRVDDFRDMPFDLPIVYCSCANCVFSSWFEMEGLSFMSCAKSTGNSTRIMFDTNGTASQASGTYGDEPQIHSGCSDFLPSSPVHTEYGGMRHETVNHSLKMN